jgi:hypothetical protein
MPGELDRVSLTDAIDGLRRQIMEAAKKAEVMDPQTPRFRIAGIEIELTVALEDSGTAGVEAGWWVFKAKAEMAAKDAVTHKVKLTLNVGDIEVGSGTQTTR